MIEGRYTLQRGVYFAACAVLNDSEITDVMMGWLECCELN